MKHLIPILTFLLSYWGSAVLAQSGMAVFGDVSIAENTSLVVQNDELTLGGNIIGEGKLIMAGNDTQTIIAGNHAIDRLVVANPKAVNVKGKLTIRKSMTVERGHLTLETEAELVVLPQARVTLAAGSKLIRADDFFQTGKGIQISGRQMVNAGVLRAEELVLSDDPSRLINRTIPLAPETESYQSPALRTHTMPPRQT